MISIYKYTLLIEDKQVIRTRKGAEFLTVQFQNGMLCTWTKVDLNQPEADFELLTVGTGMLLPELEGKHIGTYQLADGAIVFHVFARELP